MGKARSRRVALGPFEDTVDDLNHHGDGVTHRQGRTVFVPDSLPGERIRYHVRRQQPGVDQAVLDQVVTPSRARVTPPCPHFGVCGGCSLQHMHPADQIVFKQQQVVQTLARIGHVSPERLADPVTGPVTGYRRRARLGVKYVYKKAATLVGFRERASPYVAWLDGCEVLLPALGRRIQALRELVDGLSIRTQLPQIELAAGDNAVVLVLRVLQPPTDDDRDKLVAFSRATGLWVYLQPGGPDSLEPLMPATPSLFYRLPAFDLSIAFEPIDFIQINAAVNRELVSHALQALDVRADERVLDLFSGVGNFSLPLARRAARVIAVEGEPRLVQRVRSNALANGLNNVTAFTANLARASGEPAWLHGDFDKLLLDPPRSGAREILPALAAKRPRRIVYVSCHPATLARDAAALVHEHGYRLRQVGVLDMFPHTAHVETMAVFEGLASIMTTGKRASGG